MRWLIVKFAVACVLAGLFALPAAADDFAACRDRNGDESIAACTRAIDSQAFKGEELADLYYYRSLEYRFRGDAARAIADREAANRLRGETPSRPRQRTRVREESRAPRHDSEESRPPRRDREESRPP